VRPRRDLQALQDRRMAAADMFRRGKRQVDVVNELGVSAQTASRWYRAWQEGGRAALAGADRAGRLRKLSEDQLAQVQAALVKGPRANGFATEMWTLARVAEVIETVSGVRYSQTQTWTILRQRLGWSRQRPARRAVERNDEAIATWVKQDWPRIKKRAAPRRLDHLPRRERVLPPPTGESDLGAERPDTSATAPVLLDQAVDVRGAGLPARPQPGSAGIPDQGRRLQHRLVHRLPHRPARPLRRREDHADLGQPALAQVQAE
jgi:transposase